MTDRELQKLAALLLKYAQQIRKDDQPLAAEVIMLVRTWVAGDVQ